ncbi:hypothetical protein [Gluconobacter morbifer]|uniref:Uncharacterized protein n=1 Tax=Gluconobacter morbifer G707 TaxID=1088869 RepID=G6XHL9_9PROT|nr:hypothetical protein [Gluconobacter morbifer]EHH69677.1 hypothetical protein GMO_09850 [Gluconobacter morbifer G707]
MSETRDSVAGWHLKKSRPYRCLDYFNPRASFAGQANTLVTRFRAVQALCEAGDRTIGLTQLRNELAFHLVKMSRWWQFEFCPNTVLGVMPCLFIAYVQAHVARVVEDCSLYDLFTRQNYLHANDSGHVMLLGHETGWKTGRRTFFGVDGKKGFRVGVLGGDGLLRWTGKVFQDFPHAWLQGRLIRAQQDRDPVVTEETLHAMEEHARLRPWIQKYFHGWSDDETVQDYRALQKELEACRTVFGRVQFEPLENSFAFRMTEIAFRRRMTLADLVHEMEGTDLTHREANVIKRQARAYVATALDRMLREEKTLMLDRVISYLPRRCSRGGQSPENTP